MFGRSDELAAVSDLVAANSLVTIVGPGGVGKSTLALAVAEGNEAAFLFADMSALHGDDLDEELAGEMGFRSWSELLGGVRGRRLLVVLDNAEHLADELADRIPAFLAASDQLTVLVTSREMLSISDERVFRLAPLGLEGRPSPASQLLEWFIEGRGLPVPDDRDELESLCASLDGLPLALELAAGSASVLTPSEIRTSVETRLDLLSRARYRGPERVSSLDATIEWSLDLLDSKSRSFMESLSIFDGPFSLELALALGGFDDHGEGVEMLKGLVEKSLLLHESSGRSSAYRMLNTVRTHCRQRLHRQDRFDEVGEGLVRAVITMCDRLRAPQTHMGDPGIPDEVFRSFHNISAAVQWCLAHDSSSRRVVGMMMPLFWLEDVGHQTEAVELIRRVVERWPDQADGATLGVLANLEKTIGRVPDARSSASRAIATSDPLGLVLGHRVLGIIERQAGGLAVSLEHYRKGAQVARATGWDAHAMELQAHSALAVAGLGRLEEAIDRLESLSQESEAYPLCHRCVELFRTHLLMHDQPDRAVAIALEILEDARKHGHTWAIGSAAYEVAVGALLGSDTQTGRAHLADALESFEAARSLTELHQTLLIAASVLDQGGQPGPADLARAGLAHLPARTIANTDQQLLDRLEIDTDPSAPIGLRFDLDSIVEALRGPPGVAVLTTDGASPANRFIKRGDTWELSYREKTAFVRDAKGMEDLSHLLRSPGKEISAMDLAGAEVVESDSGAPIDARARSLYEQRIRELQAEVEDAEAASDPHRAERASLELDELVDHLAAAYGLGGRARAFGATAERARGAVTWRIRAAIDRIRSEHPPLGDHLDRSVRTGRFCVYDPGVNISWEI